MKIYCSGIGGIGLSAYAALRHANGHEVLGSDRAESVVLGDLREQGISVSLNQDGTFIPDDCDLFVYSEAIPASAPERRRAEELSLRSLTYFQALGELSRDCKVIAVCGTHGKSSTVAMAADVLTDAGKDPTIVVGTKLPALQGRNWRSGRSNLFLLEACEYRRSFLSLSPDIVLLTNADGDHFDAFASVQDYRDAFVEFLKLVPGGGTIVTHLSDPDCTAITSRITRAEVIDADSIRLPTLSVPGVHMQKNAQLVMGLAELFHIDEKAARQSLQKYAGCWRRLEVKGTYGEGVTVIDDYAHHPREIRASIAAVRGAYAGRRLVCAFQPHMHDRTLKLYEEFVAAFEGADLLLLTDVYDARSDVETDRVDLPRFTEDVRRGSNIAVLCIPALSELERRLKVEILQPNDVLLCMGAGDITSVATALMA